MGMVSLQALKLNSLGLVKRYSKFKFDELAIGGKLCIIYIATAAQLQFREQRAGRK